MNYSNPKIPEGINVSKTHPLSEFTLLAAGVFGTLILLVLIFGFFADRFAHHIPYEYESRIQFDLPFKTDSQPELQDYLQQLADKLADTQQLPQGMRINVSVVQSDTVNAFATLGGRVVFFTGLLERIPHENALAMVMAHEIAHIKHRHPIRALGRGIVIGLVVAIFSSSIGSDIVSSSMNDVGFISQLKYSRNNEVEADETAMASLKQLYGHVNGGAELFKILKREEGKHQFVPEFFNTHPNTDDRIRRIDQAINTGMATDLNTTALPEQYQHWLAD